jgi:hypothetical protein
LGFELAFEFTSRINVWHLLGRYELQWLAEATGRMHFAPTVLRQPAIKVLRRADVVAAT